MKTKDLTHKTIKALLIKCLVLHGFVSSNAQTQVYDNFEGTKAVRYGERSGVLDTVARNPAPGEQNKSTKCALYVRNGARKFDNIKMGLSGHLANVDKFATHLGTPERLRMKVYTAAPPGTLVEILLGSKRGNNDYPAGTHSQYQAYTKVSNQWHEIEFIFSQIPQGSETSASQIDQATLLFNPNSANSDTYYFDDLTGPSIVPAPAGSEAANQGAVDQGHADQTKKESVEAVNTAQPVTAPEGDNSKKETLREKKGKRSKKKD